MYRIILLLFLLSIPVWYLQAQDKATLRILKGVVVDSVSGQPVPAALLCMATDSLCRNIVASGIADMDGRFDIRVSGQARSLWLRITCLGYRAKAVPLPAAFPDSLQIRLVSAGYQLSEIVVKEEVPAMQNRGDTLFFHADAFRDSTEEVVEDLLRKMPGIEVSENGRISVHGRSVSRVLIEGDDLLGRNYTLGTRNIRAEYIEAVSVIFNYNENVALKHVNLSEEVVLDLQFKRKGVWLALGNIALGHGYKPVYEWYGNALNIGAVKWIGLSNGSNVGRGFLDQELHAMYDNWAEGWHTPVLYPVNITILPGLENPGLPRALVDDQRSMMHTVRTSQRLQEHLQWKGSLYLESGGDEQCVSFSQVPLYKYDTSDFQLARVRQITWGQQKYKADTELRYEALDGSMTFFARAEGTVASKEAADRYRRFLPRASSGEQLDSFFRKTFDGLSTAQWTWQLGTRHALQWIGKWQRRKVRSMQWFSDLPSLSGARWPNMQQALPRTRETGWLALAWHLRLSAHWAGKVQWVKSTVHWKSGVIWQWRQTEEDSLHYKYNRSMMISRSSRVESVLQREGARWRIRLAARRGMEDLGPRFGQRPFFRTGGVSLRITRVPRHARNVGLRMYWQRMPPAMLHQFDGLVRYRAPWIVQWSFQDTLLLVSRWGAEGYTNTTLMDGRLRLTARTRLNWWDGQWGEAVITNHGGYLESRPVIFSGGYSFLGNAKSSFFLLPLRAWVWLRIWYSVSQAGQRFLHVAGVPLVQTTRVQFEYKGKLTHYWHLNAAINFLSQRVDAESFRRISVFTPSCTVFYRDSIWLLSLGVAGQVVRGGQEGFLFQPPTIQMRVQRVFSEKGTLRRISLSAQNIFGRNYWTAYQQDELFGTTTEVEGVPLYLFLTAEFAIN